MLFYYDLYSIYRQPDKSCKLLHVERIALHSASLLSMLCQKPSSYNRLHGGMNGSMDW